MAWRNSRLRGKDLRPYQPKQAEQYVIATHNGYDHTPAVDIDNYLAVKDHLDASYHRLLRRSDQGHAPYNLRSCSYYAEFAKEKLFWTDLSPEGRFAHFEREMYCLNGAFFMTGASLKYLQAAATCTSGSSCGPTEFHKDGRQSTGWQSSQPFCRYQTAGR